MNKEIFDQLPANEQPVAAKLNSVSENMKVPQNFQWNLESQLMHAYQNKSQPNKSRFSKLIVPAAWTLAAVFGIFILTWAIRSLVPTEQINPAAPNPEVPVETFESKVRQETICEGSLAVAHGFSVAVTNEGKTAFIPFELEEPGSELRSFIWSTDGKQLAILGNTRGSGSIYLANTIDHELLPALTNPNFGYLYEFAWSHDGERFAMWSTGNNKKIYLLNKDGVGLEEKQLNVQILGGLQFYPDGSSVVFYGATPTSAGLFELMLADSDAVLINSTVESAGSYAFSPDGSHLAYMDYDRNLGEAKLYSEDLMSRELTILGALPIPKGSGSSIPNVANLSWSQDGSKLIFEFGRGAADRAIYNANTNGSGMVKIVDSAHAPSISADGNCLAYINNKQVFLLDLSSSQFEPFFLANLPAPRGTTDFRLDQLQWQP